MKSKERLAEARVRHYRRFNGVVGLFTAYDGKRRGFGHPTPRGGETFVEVETTLGRIGKGHSACSKKDNFSRKKGRDIAMLRALLDLEVHT